MSPFARLLPAAAIVASTACATSRGELDLRIELPPNPASGPAVRVAEPKDLRKFEIDPPKPSIPSLKYDDDIDKPAIKARAIARKRNTFGAALGDILLPEGRSAAQLVAEVLTKAFREAGYRVVDAQSPDGATAPVVEADIEQMWAWMTPGFWTIRLDTQIRVRIRGPGIDNIVINTGSSRRAGSAGTRQWRTIYTDGLNDLGQKVRDLAETARATIGSAPSGPRDPPPPPR